MKKYIALILAFLLMAQLCACGRPAQPEMPTGTGQDAGLTDANIYGAWYASPEMGSAEITINHDGTCLYNGQQLTWSVWLEEDNYINLVLENGTYLSIYNYEQGLPTLSDDALGIMLQSAQLWQYRGFWESDFGDEGYIDEWSVQFSNKVANGINEGHMEVYDDGDTVICVTTAADGMQQILRMHNVDGYSVIEMTDSAGMIHMFYDPANRPPVDTQAVMYHDAVKKLNDVMVGGRIFYEDTEKTLGGNAAYRYVYSLFEQLGDYKDAKQYLANFKVIEDVLVDIQEPGEAFNTGLLYLYGEHDAQGRRLTGCVSTGVISPTDFGFYACGAFYQLTYGEDGLVSQILTHDGDERVPVAIGIPAYDAQGNMISLDVTWNTENYGTMTYTSYFTYDAQGCRLTHEIPDLLHEEVSYGRYYYDDDGKLLQTIVDTIMHGRTEPSLRTIDEYIYDDNGILTESRSHHIEPGFMSLWTLGITQYSYDLSGKLQSKTVSTGWVYKCLSDDGKQGMVDENVIEISKTFEVFLDMMDHVFDRDPDDWGVLRDHGYLIDTTQMALEWRRYNYDLQMYETPVWTEREYIYTDVYLYCPEN